MKNESKQGNSAAVSEETVARTEKPEPARDSSFLEEDFGVVRVAEDLEKNRIQLFFSEKPEPATLALLKKSGFRWSPQSKSWHQPLSNAAKFAVTAILERLGVLA